MRGGGEEDGNEEVGGEAFQHADAILSDSAGALMRNFAAMDWRDAADGGSAGKSRLQTNNL
jgi:hypothetical protein